MTEGKRFTLKSPHGKEAAKEVLCVGRVCDLWGKQGLRFPLRHKNPHSAWSPKTQYCRTKCWKY